MENHSNQKTDEVPVGADIIEIERFKGLSPESPFVRRVYSDDEILYLFSFTDPAPHLAVNFAGKEAVIKTLGTNDVISYRSIEILRNTNGKPYVRMFDEESERIHVSLSHSQTHAIAVAINLSEHYQLHSTTVRNIMTDIMSQLIQEE